MTITREKDGLRAVRSRSRHISTWLSICVFAALGGCGGGADGPAATQQATTREHAQSVGAPSANDTLLNVIRPLGTEEIIAVKDANGNYVRYNGANFFRLEALPQVIANHPWINDAGATGHLRVRFARGTYRFYVDTDSSTQGWVWPQAATGKDANHQIVLEAMPGDEGLVTISGSARFSVNQQAGVDEVAVNVPFKADHVWAEGRRAVRARTPNVGEGFFYLKGAMPYWTLSSGQIVDQIPNFVYDSADVRDRPVGAQAFQPDPASMGLLTRIQGDPDAVIVRLERWQAMRHKVMEVDAAGQRVRVAPANPADWYFNRHLGRRYFVENTLEALDAPGEWFWAGNVLKYRPIDKSQSRELVLDVPYVERILSMPLSNAQPVRFITFKSLSFQYAREAGRKPTYVDKQGDTGLSAAIELNRAKDITFDQCEVAHTGGHGVWFNKYVESSVLSNSKVYDMGAGAVKIGAPDVAGTTRDVLVYQNRIYSTGNEYPGSSAVWVGKSSENAISRNLIADTTYTGISVGYQWDHLESSARDNFIGQNVLYNIAQSVLSDLGGIYTLGDSPGTWMLANIIKNVDAYNDDGRGIYADEGSGHLLIKDNVVVGADGSGFFQHWGFENAVINNAFVDVGTGFAIAKRDRALKAGETAIVPTGFVPADHVPATLQDNRFFPKSGTLVWVPQPDARNVIDGNNQWKITAPVISGNLVSAQFAPNVTFVDVGEGKLCHVCSVDNGLTVDVRGPLDAPVISGMSFSTPPVGIASPPPTTEWSAKARWSGIRSQEPSVILDFRAEHWPVGVSAQHGNMLADWRAESPSTDWVTLPPSPAPVIIEEEPTLQKKMLMLKDAPRTKDTFWPLIQGDVNYKQGGQATVEFAVKFDAGSMLYHEWRDDKSGANAGPSVKMEATGSNGLVNVKVANKVVATVASRYLVNFKLVSSIPSGASSTPSKWWMTINCNGQSQTVHDLPGAKPTWSAFNLLIFASTANVVSSTGLASIQVSRQNDVTGIPPTSVDFDLIQQPIPVCQ